MSLLELPHYVCDVGSGPDFDKEYWVSVGTGFDDELKVRQIGSGRSHFIPFFRFFISFFISFGEVAKSPSVPVNCYMQYILMCSNISDGLNNEAGIAGFLSPNFCIPCLYHISFHLSYTILSGVQAVGLAGFIGSGSSDKYLKHHLRNF